MLHPSLLAAPIVALAVWSVTLIGGGTAASAHPLGNFTINHFTRIEVAESGITVYRVLDMAEIPAFQERQRMDADGDGAVTATEAERWASAAADELASNMALNLDGADVRLDEVSHEVTFPQGQSGLLLVRLTATYRVDVPDGWRESAPDVEFADENYGDRIGWREVVVASGAGAEVFDSTAPAAGISNELLAYPEDQLTSPLDVRTAAFSFRPGVAGAAPAAHTDADTAVRGNPDGYLGRFSELVARKDLGISVVALSLLAAMGFGALHALSPGHGKTVVAAYLVGTRGTAWHALLLGLTVTVTHTSSVYAIGLITLYLSEYIVPEDLYPWLGVASGALILGMGLSLFVGRMRSRGLYRPMVGWLRAAIGGSATPGPAAEFGLATDTGAASGAPAQDVMLVHAGWDERRAAGGAAGDGDDNPQSAAHHHEHVGDETPDHAYGAVDGASHRHGAGRTHTHALSVEPGKATTRQLIGLGIFGGLLPCPSAIVVMLSAVALHRVGFGLLLIVAFSLGLAGVLTAIGIGVVYAQALSRRVPLVRGLTDRAASPGSALCLVVRAFPVVAAGLVTVAGTLILLRAVETL